MDICSSGNLNKPSVNEENKSAKQASNKTSKEGKASAKNVKPGSTNKKTSTSSSSKSPSKSSSTTKSAPSAGLATICRKRKSDSSDVNSNPLGGNSHDSGPCAVDTANKDISAGNVSQMSAILDAVNNMNERMAVLESKVSHHQDYYDEYEDDYDYDDDYSEEANASHDISSQYDGDDGSYAVSKKMKLSCACNDSTTKGSKDKDGDEVTIDNHDNCAGTSDAGSAQPSDSASNIFKDSREKITKGTESVSEDIDKDLADLVNTAFNKGLSYEQVKEIAEKISRPDNCSKVHASVRVNALIWGLLKPQTRSFDEKMQRLQSFIAKAGCALAQVVHMINNPVTRVNVDDILKKGVDGLCLLGHAYHVLCLRRRELFKPDVDWRFANICSSTDIEHTSLLFGDNISESIKKVGDDNKATNMLRGPKPKFNRGRQTNRGRSYGRQRGGHYAAGKRGFSDRSYRGRSRGRLVVVTTTL